MIYQNIKLKDLLTKLNGNDKIELIFWEHIHYSNERKTYLVKDLTKVFKDAIFSKQVKVAFLQNVFNTWEVYLND